MKEALEYLIEMGESRATQEYRDIPEQAVMVPSGYNIQDIEQMLPAPVRYRAQINTHSIDDFVKVTKAEAVRLSEDGHMPPCFINDEDMSATSIFNLGTPDDPGHGDHRASLTLKKTPEFQELLRINGNRMDQKTAAEWLEDWREFLTPIWDTEIGERGTMAAAINVVRNVQVEASVKSQRSVTDFGAEKSDIENIEARGRDLPCPARFIFKCEAFEHLSEYDVPLRLSLITGDRPQLTLRIIRLDNLLHVLMEEFKEKLSSQLGADANVVIGTLTK